MIRLNFVEFGRLKPFMTNNASENIQSHSAGITSSNFQELTDIFLCILFYRYSSGLLYGVCYSIQNKLKYCSKQPKVRDHEKLFPKFPQVYINKF